MNKLHVLWNMVSPPTKEVMVQNIPQHSLVTQQVICDHVKSVGGVLNVVFSKELLWKTEIPYCP